MRIALVGAGGFVGAALESALESRRGARVVPVLRDGYETARDDGTYDLLINAAMPSKRYWARQNPRLDFAETVAKTSRLLTDWRWEKFVQISSISARSQLDTVYGRHKAAAEKLCGFGANLTVRLGAMYGGGLDKGVLVDMAHDRPVFVDGASRYCFAPLAWVAGWIAANLDAAGIVEVGARDAVAVGDVAAALGSRSEFQGARDDQVIVDPVSGAPSAKRAIDFARKLRAAAAA